MRVLQITTTGIYPPSKGGEHRSHGLLTKFRAAGDDIVRFCQSGPISRYLRDEEQIVKIQERYVEQRGGSNPLHDLARSPAMFGFPYVLLNPALEISFPSKLQAELSKADVVLVEGPWQVPAVQRRADGTPVIYSSHNVELEMYSSMYRNSMWQTPLQKTVKRIERTAIAKSTAVICTSSRDKSIFRTTYETDFRSLLVPNGVYESDVNEPAVSPATLEDIHSKLGRGEGTAVGLFIGSGHKANVEAVNRLKEIAKACSADGYDIEFVVIGSVCDQVEEEGHLHLLGFVDNLEPYYAIADVALNPMLSGSGSNIKLLEYMAKGIPTISTPFGTRGFDLDHEDELLVADIEEFPAAISRLLSDSKFCASLGDNAQNAVRSGYTWEQISASFRDQLQSLISTGR